MKLNVRIEQYLSANSGTFTYGQIAQLFETSARAVGSCMKAIAKRNIAVTERVVFSK
jgi:alkylated DNA nucleotide flippase Atl1